MEVPVSARGPALLTAALCLAEHLVLARFWLGPGAAARVPCGARSPDRGRLSHLLWNPRWRAGLPRDSARGTVRGWGGWVGTSVAWQGLLRPPVTSVPWTLSCPWLFPTMPLWPPRPRDMATGLPGDTGGDKRRLWCEGSVGPPHPARSGDWASSLVLCSPQPSPRSCFLPSEALSRHPACPACGGHTGACGSAGRTVSTPPVRALIGGPMTVGLLLWGQGQTKSGKITSVVPASFKTLGALVTY